MNPGPPSGSGLDPSQAQFAPTQWSLVIGLRAEDPERAARALEEVCRAYWPPLYAFARRKGIASHDAKDLVQGLFERLCTRGGFQGYAPREGVKFRTWLLTCLQRFEVEEWRKVSASKRGGGTGHVPLDLEDDEGRRFYEVPGSASPEAAFDAALAQRVCQRAFQRLELEQQKGGNAELYLELKPQLLDRHAEGAMQRYARIGERFGMTAQGVAKRQDRLRSRFGEILREEIGRLVPHPNGIDDEIRYLLSMLG